MLDRCVAGQQTDWQFEDWGKLIGDVPAATAILDRFLHHAEVIPITGKSYRLRNQAVEGAKPANAPTGPAAEPANAPKNSKAEGEVSDGKSASSRRDRKKDSAEPAQT